MLLPEVVLLGLQEGYFFHGAQQNLQQSLGVLIILMDVLRF